MFFLISEKFDTSTNDVIDWLDIDVLRVNNKDIKINKIDYQREKVLFTYKDRVISSKSITSFWYRRGEVLSSTIDGLEIPDIGLEYITYGHLSYEWEEMIRFLTNQFKNDKDVTSLGSYDNKDRKLDQLFEAQQCGLNIPKTLITTSKAELIKFYELCTNKIITKGINSSPSFTFNNVSLEGYTEEMNSEFIEQLPNTFFPSLFQENIIKQYELRIFFLKDKFYSMAIFSQNDKQTKTDLRKYNDQKPNRTVPYQLPKDIEDKLCKFMSRMGLDTGSIDMIVDKSDNYFFLEVNPNGQFGMVSTPCNYYIERDIAKILIRE
jgi:ATP-GRASP peptide maturase of grasp-with-spasm system